MGTFGRHYLHEQAFEGTDKKLRIGAYLDKFAQWNCNQCPAWPEHRQKEMGCKGSTSLPIWTLTSRGERFDIRECPNKLITPETAQLLRYYWGYKDGYLPLAGGLLNQANAFVEAIEILNAEYAERRKQETNG